MTREDLPVAAIDLLTAMQELGRWGCALKYETGERDDPFEDDKEPSWSVVDVEGWCVGYMGMAATWQGAYVDALATLGAFGDEDDDMHVENTSEPDRRKLQRIRAVVEELLTGMIQKDPDVVAASLQDPGRETS